MFYVMVTDDTTPEIHAFWSKRAAEKFESVVSAELEGTDVPGSVERVGNRTARLTMEKQLREVANAQLVRYEVGEIPRMPIDELWTLYKAHVLNPD